MTIYKNGEVLSHLQNKLYDYVNPLSDSHKNAGRLLSIPVSIADATLEILKPTLTLISSLAFTALNFFGAAFSKIYNLENAKNGLKNSLISAVHIPVKIIMTPLMTIYQISLITIDPFKTRSLSTLYAKLPDALNFSQIIAERVSP